MAKSNGLDLEFEISVFIDSFKAELKPSDGDHGMGDHGHWKVLKQLPQYNPADMPPPVLLSPCPWLYSNASPACICEQSILVQYSSVQKHSFFAPKLRHPFFSPTFETVWKLRRRELYEKRQIGQFLSQRAIILKQGVNVSTTTLFWENWILFFSVLILNPLVRRLQWWQFDIFSWTKLSHALLPSVKSAPPSSLIWLSH